MWPLRAVRATAFALNILIIHALGDALAFPAIGYISGHSQYEHRLPRDLGDDARSGVIWLTGMKYLGADTARSKPSPNGVTTHAVARACRCTSLASASAKASGGFVRPTDFLQEFAHHLPAFRAIRRGDEARLQLHDRAIGETRVRPAL